jgi:hypothetical protein
VVLCKALMFGITSLPFIRSNGGSAGGAFSDEVGGGISGGGWRALAYVGRVCVALGTQLLRTSDPQ